MRIGEQAISDNWINLNGIINDTFKGDRLENIKKLHDHFEERMTLAPASGTKWFHNAFPGGYVAHVLNVINWSLEYYELFKRMGMHVDDINEETVIFCAMFHDLGKIGDLENDYYITNTDEWKAKKFGRPYDHNPELYWMTVTDRAFWLLQHFGITVSQTEFFGIKMADGLYEDGNKGYFYEGAEWKAIKTNIGFIIHYADSSATRLEKENYMLSGESKVDFPRIMKGVQKQDPMIKDLDLDKLGDLFK
tara:strand:- start:896 stop:1642 length:747 start_codon:yes stop_codon:yes gene_type:complete